MRASFIAVGVGLLANACSCERSNDTDGGTRSDAAVLDAGPASACIPGLEHLVVEPAQSTLTLAQGTSAPLSFTATGVMHDASTRDLTRVVAWTVSRGDGRNAGSIDPDGSYHPAPDEGGVVSIQATDGCVVGQTTLVISIDVVIIDDATIPPLFVGPSVEVSNPHRPTFVYPSDQTRLPRNLWNLLLQWSPAGNTVFQLDFKGPFTHVTVYTDGLAPACAGAAAACWQTTPSAWEFIARANGGYPVSMRVSGHTPGDPHVYVEPTLSLVISRSDWPGAVIYWSTNVAGLRRATWAGVDRYAEGNPPTALPDGSRLECVGCHTVSPSGRLLVAGVNTSLQKGVSLLDGASIPPTPGPWLGRADRQFSTFSPDETRVVTNVGAVLHLFDTDGGIDLGPLPVDVGSQPSWSPLGDALAYVDQLGESPHFARLWMLRYLGRDRWSATPRLLASPQDGGTNLYPAFAPDGRSVVFSTGLGDHDDLRTLLEWVDVDGGAPVELFNANRIVNNQVTEGLHENALPTWGPTNDYGWVVFSSKRPFGALTPAAGATNHLWVAAVDLNAVGTGLDPSFPAFYLPTQRFDENNHRAFWLRDAVPAPPLDGGFPDWGLGDAGTPDAGVDAGVCLASGTACDQINPPACCSGGLCDLIPDGGFACR